MTKKLIILIILVFFVAGASTYTQHYIGIQDAEGDRADVIATDGYLGLVSVAPGHVSTVNSTTALLTEDGVYTGTFEDVTNHGVIVVTVKSDVASATDGLEIQFSCNGTDVITSDVYTIPADTGKTFSFQAASQYFRVKYTNSGSIQSSFNLQTVLKPYYVKPSSHRIQDAIIDDDDAELVKAVLTGKNPGGNFVNFQATTAGNFKVSLEELENDVSSNSNTQLNVTPYHADGTEGALITGLDYVAGKSGIDASTETLQTITYEHHEIHSGSHFNICGYKSFSNAEVYDFTVVTPNTTEWTHMTFSIVGTDAVSIAIHEGAVVDETGTAVTAYNNDRNSANTTSLTIRTGDTFTGTGTVISTQYAGALKQTGNIGREREIILKQNTTYIFRITNQITTANIISWCAEWYEHTGKN